MFTSVVTVVWVRARAPDASASVARVSVASPWWVPATYAVDTVTRWVGARAGGPRRRISAAVSMACGHARRPQQVHLDGGVERGVEGDRGGGVHDDVARGEHPSSVVVEVEPVAPDVAGHGAEPGARSPRRSSAPSSSRSRLKQSLRTTSRANRAAASERRVGRTSTTTITVGDGPHAGVPPAPCPRKPVAPVTKMRLPARASAMDSGSRRARAVVGVVTSATISVYHMVGGRGERAEHGVAPPRGWHRGPHPRRRVVLVRVPRLRGDLARRPGRGSRHAQTVDPLLVPVQRGPARSAHRPLGHRTGDRPGGVPGGRGIGLVAGRGGGAVGLPPGLAVAPSSWACCARSVDWGRLRRPGSCSCSSRSATRASSFLEEEMDAGHMRRHEPRLLLLAIYSTVVGMITEVEVLRALGEEPTPRSLVRRRQEILRLLRSALLVDGDAPSTAPRQDGGAGGRGRVGRGGV